MRPVRSFEEFTQEGVVKEQSPDISRANSLKREAEQTEAFLYDIIKTIGITEQSTNTIIKITYDSIMERIRAAMLQEGYNATGQGSHEAEVAYLRTLGFNEKHVQFCDQLRYFRNGIMYYGKTLDKEYAEKTLLFLKHIKEHLG